MEMDVIYVAVQYRLGIFGFMSTWGGSVEDNLLGGNYGLLDQQLAIRFLKDNAANFGGDPDKITIFGESAGGESVSFQVLNEKSASMVTSGIIQSGPAMFDIQLSQERLSL